MSIRRWSMQNAVLYIGIFGCLGFSAGIITAACHAPLTIVTPAGQAAFRADLLIKQLGAFQNVIIDLSRTGRIKTEDARLIVLWISGDRTATPPQTGLLKAIVDHPSEWKPAARVTWATFRPKLAAISELAAWLPIVDDLLGGT